MNHNVIICILLGALQASMILEKAPCEFENIEILFITANPDISIHQDVVEYLNFRFKEAFVGVVTETPLGVIVKRNMEGNLKAGRLIPENYDRLPVKDLKQIRFKQEENIRIAISLDGFNTKSRIESITNKIFGEAPDTKLGAPKIGRSPLFFETPKFTVDFLQKAIEEWCRRKSALIGTNLVKQPDVFYKQNYEAARPRKTPVGEASTYFRVLLNSYMLDS
eukprot:GHVP01051514.1.p1 GENE.GHVP01051514.1~~GHVP01051514.1.p1  ORF type:complete len:222 (+),score=33.79 GHVP01051514.1:41-706(+)